MGEIERTSVELQAWYFIYKAGKDFWNEWVEDISPLVDGTYTKDIPSEMVSHMIEDFRARFDDWIERNGFSSNPSKIALPSPEYMYFSNTEWNEIADFEGFVIPKKISFNNTLFKRGATFKNATFKEDVDFKNCIFEPTKKWISFYKTSFEKRALFHDTKFLSKVSFSEAKFDAGSLFLRVIFDGDAFFQDTVFRRSANFTSATFRKRALFQNTVFKQNLLFFGNDYSDGAAIHPEAAKTEATFVEPPELLGINIDGHIAIKPTQLTHLKSKGGDAYKWVKLKKLMADHHNHREENDFFAKELECRAIDASLKEKALIDLYRMTADYGRSATRPFLALLILLIVMVVPYMAFFGSCTAETIKMAANISLDNSFLFTLNLGQEPQELQSNLGFNLITITHKIIATTLLFLIGLGIRNRLRIK